MASARLFLGGLSDKIRREDIGEKLSHYGPVLSIDLKEKTDPEGNILFRFAYVNVDAAPSQIEQCIQQLNGASWKGSQLRVERAKESFLERLNRERAARQQGEHKTYPGRVDNEPNLEETDYSEGHSATLENQTSKVCDIEHSEKRKAHDDLKKDLFSSENTDVHKNDQVTQPDAHSVLSVREKKKKKDHQVEEKMLSSFKKFSSVWADSDNEYNEKGAEADHGESPEEQQTGESIMASAPEGNKFVKVAKDLSFGQNTSGFSLLARFSKLNQKETEKEEELAAVSVPRTLITVQQKVKKRSFFIASDDPEIEGAIDWMTQPITEEIIKEFEEVLPDLRQVIRTRSFRAKKEERDHRAQKHGSGRGRGRGQNRGRPAADTGNPYRDHRWRERAVKK